MQTISCFVIPVIPFTTGLGFQDAVTVSRGQTEEMCLTLLEKFMDFESI